MKTDRRGFLGLIGKGAVVSTICGLESILTGCTTPQKVSQDQLKTHYYRTVLSSINDPHNLLRLLKEKEYVLPDKVFDAYAKTTHNSPEWICIPIAFYIQENCIDTDEKRKEFINRLQELDLSEDEIADYYTILTDADIIILNARVLELKGNHFEKSLLHERVHKRITRLSDEERNYLLDVANKLLNTKYDDNQRLVQEKTNTKFEGVAELNARINPEELYTFLAENEFTPEVEITLRIQHPKAYRIFEKILDDCKLK